jgi:tetratricopeptide (TPR) repeat protein
MLRNILRVPFIRTKAVKSASSFLATKSNNAGRKSSRKNSNNSPLVSVRIYYPQSSFIAASRFYSTKNNSIGNESIEDLINHVTSCIQKGDLNLALEYGTKAVEKSKTADELLNSLTLKLVLSVALGKTGWEDDFLATIKRMDPASAQFHEIWERMLGNLVGSFKSYSPDCNIFFDKALKAFPGNFIVTLKQAEVLLSFKLANEAENCLNKAIEIDAHKCRPWILLWTIYPSKTSYLKKAIECPDSERDTLLWSEYAKKQIFEDNDVDGGIESLKKAAADRPILPGVEQVLNQISTQLAVKGDFVSAEKVVRLWIEESPKKAAAWSILGSINNAQQRAQDAEKCFRKAIELDSNMVSAWFNLGNMLPAKEGIPMLMQALKLSPQLHKAHYRLAMHYGELAQYDLALESINKAIELNKQVSDYQVLKSMILEKVKS